MVARATMSSPSADRKPPLDYGVQIRFIKDLDDTGGGYVERSRGVGGSAGGSGTPPSSKYGVAVRVQGISGQPYVVLKDGEKGDSYGVQLKTQPPDQIPASGHSSPFISLPRGQRDRAQTPKDPYRPFGQASSPSEESASEFGNLLRRPPGDGQAGSHGEGEGGSEECPTSTPPASGLEKKDFGGLNEAGLRRVGQIGNGGAESNWPVTGKQVSQYTSAEAFSEPPASVEPTGEAIDTKSLAPINKLISKFNSSGPSNATSGMPSQTRGRSGARTHLQFDERRRSRSLDSHKEPQEQPPPSPTINPYAPIATTKSTCTLKSPTPTTYSSLGRGSASVAKVPAVSASKPPTVCLSPKTSVAMETPPSILKKHVAPELLKSQSQNTNSMYGEEAQLKQAIYNILQDGSTESDVSLRRKVSLIQECFSGIKTTPGEYGVKTVPAENERKTKQLQQQLDQLKRELGLAQDQLVELRMEKEGVEFCLHQQEDELAQLQEQLRRVLENTRTDSLHMDLMAVQAEMSEAVMLRQKQEEILRMRERELTALKGALKDEVASHDKEMEALREQYRQDMEALRQSMEHVSQSQQEIEEERQKVNASILALEEELDSYKEQGDCWREQMISVKQELLQAQQEKKEMEEKLLRMRETCETDSHPLAQLPSSAQDVGTTKENSLELEEANTRLRERLARMSRLQSGSSSSNSEVLEEENRSLRIQLDEVRRTSSRLGQEKEELSRRVEEREKERESLRRSKSDLEEQKRLLDRALEKMNKEVSEYVQMEAMMGDSRLSVHALQSQLDEFRDRARRELQEALRLSKERLTDLQRAQGSLKSLQEEVSRLKKELLACSEERESAQLDKELLSSRLKHLESELETERTSQTDRNREIRILEDKVKSLEIELDEEKSGEELLNDRITRSREQVEQLRSELMQERSARHDLEMDKSSLERQVKELRSRITDMEGQPRPSVGVNLLESKIQELEDRLRSEEREKNSILAAQRRMERKLKDVSATLDQERNHHAEQRDQLSLRVKSLKRQVDESEEEVERLEGVRRKVLRELEEQQLLKEALQAKVSALENELKRKIQQTRRPAVASTLSSEDEDGYFDSSSITSILTESSLQTSNC
ncbi:hypothetical protein P4O66_019703 [Electrophorus voltai]|uniref:Myosin tail domain-containing protein n=1 Tax=Electrophorus voltai TaxID=2609070 RepID=A0AAD8ZW92_9TELE|nr:hypothetical protein P4O66_019703 [Electrophorus voltai]